MNKTRRSTRTFRPYLNVREGTVPHRYRPVEEWVRNISGVGYCIVPDVLSTADCARLRKVLMSHLIRERRHRRPSGHQRVLHLAVKNPIFIGPLCNPLVLAIFRQYLGADMICSSYSANTLWPGCTEQYWHVDHPYWTMPEPYPVEVPLSGHALFMLDDFSVENGATAAVPRSHKRTHLPTLGARWVDDAIILKGRAGSVILADGAWWHTSRPNLTDRPRSALLAKYTRSFCVPQENMRLQLNRLKSPSPLVRQLLGENQYAPRRGFPY
jgi:hypothetical protein